MWMEIVPIGGKSPETEAARAMLDAAWLPTSDIAAPGVLLWGLFEADTLVGVIGLERAGATGLLRSLAVTPGWRSNGLARRLCDFAFERARAWEIETLYLLTESAAGYFRALGFAEVDRTQAPPEIAATRQFSTLCPGDAAFMRKRL